LSAKAASSNQIMPEILKISSDASLKDHTQHIRGILRKGGVIAFPTDTYYGLGTDPFNQEGIRRIFEIKSRKADKPLLVLVASASQVDQLAQSRSQEADRLIQEFWPAPLTLVFKAVPELPDSLTAKTATVGIRMPGNEWTRRLIEAAGCPLTAPSANRNNEAAPQTADEVAQTFGNEIDLIIDPGPAPGGRVSTLLDTTTRPPVLIRHGAITQREIESVLNMECTLVS